MKRPTIRTSILATAALVAMVAAGVGVYRAEQKPATPAYRGGGGGFLHPLAGWYTSVANLTSLPLYAGAGANLVLIQPEPSNLAATDQYLTEADQLGVNVIVMLPGPREISPTEDGLLAQIVQRYQSHHSVYAWELWDEPDWAKTPPAVMIHAYQLVKHLDQRPVVVNFASSSCKLQAGYWRSFDILSMDHYPLVPGAKPRTVFKRQASIDARCVEAAGRHRKLGFLAVIQGFGGTLGSKTWMNPTAAQEKELATTAIHAGAMGVLYWADSVAHPTNIRNVTMALRTLI